jgi:hypothetical protein
LLEATVSKKAEAGNTLEPCRIVIRVNVDSHLPTTLELAGALAVAEEAALHGLFVEDEDLFSVANLPFTQEVTRLGGQPRILDDRSLQRALERVGSEFRRSLQRHADTHSLRWSYSSVRGRKQVLELGEQEQADILVIAQPRGRRSTHRHDPRRLLLCPDHSALALPAIRVFLEHNPGCDVELLVLEEGDDESRSRDPAMLQLLSDYPTVKVISFPAEKLAALLTSRDHSLDCIVASRQLGSERVRLITGLASCPLIIVS